MSSSERTSPTRRETLVAQTLVEMADTLEDDFDVITFGDRLAQRCVDLLGMTEAGVVIADPAGGLQVLASSSEQMRFVELVEVQAGDGPCPDAYRFGRAVSEDDLCGASGARWPEFTPAALAAGFRSAYAIPLQRRQHRVGALNLFSDVPAGLDPDDRPLAQALADTAVIAILQQRSLQDRQVLTEQLQRALDSRVVLEQAKGVIAQQASIAPDDGFPLLRDFARRRNRRLTDVARSVIEGALSASDLLPGEPDPALVPRRMSRGSAAIAPAAPMAPAPMAAAPAPSA